MGKGESEVRITNMDATKTVIPIWFWCSLTSSSYSIMHHFIDLAIHLSIKITWGAILKEVLFCTSLECVLSSSWLELSLWIVRGGSCFNDSRM